jgi:hypothetical protein
MHHLDGEHAMQYIHRRDSSSDFDRGRRQRKLLMAMWDQALTPNIVSRIPELWVAMADSFKTDLPLEQVIGLASIALQISPNNIRQGAISHNQLEDWITPGGAWVLLPHNDKIQAYLESFYAPKSSAPQDTAEKVPVQVLNGSYRNQAEQLAAASMGRAGFEVIQPGQADHLDYAQTEIVVYRGDPAAGLAVANVLNIDPSAVQDPMTASPSDPPSQADTDRADIVVILGADYDPCQR